MSCTGCINRGLIHTENSDSAAKAIDGLRKLPASNWLKNYEFDFDRNDLVEVRFKNTRKEYFLNTRTLKLKENDIVAVEALRGHDIGIVSLKGPLVLEQVKKRKIEPGIYKFGSIYRKATKQDLKVWYEAMEKEKPTLVQARRVIKDLGLDMKLSDVEYQGDNSKATFFYIAESRIDFRELIKILAREFNVRIEMRQIGVRQEAGRVGGLGSCGRELCCSSWRTNLQSIPVNAAKIQELPINMQKLAGQCGKIKCCMIYELDTYMEARQDIPKTLLELETTSGIAYHQKTDVLKRIMYYSFDVNSVENLIPVSVERVKEIIGLNKKGIKVETLIDKIPLKAHGIEFVGSKEAVDRFNRKNI